MIVIKKLVVFGGTFNPPHIGHLSLAENAFRELEADKVIFMTSGTPPHKNSEIVIDKKHRFEMVKLLIGKNNNFEASDLEISENKKSYTAETLLKLKAIYGDGEIYFIIGLDSFFDLEKWYKPELVFKECVIAVSQRGGVGDENFEKQAAIYREKYNAVIVKIDMPEMEISSTDIRNKIKNGKSVKYMLTKEVLEYIEKHGLYKE